MSDTRTSDLGLVIRAEMIAYCLFVPLRLKLEAGEHAGFGLDVACSAACLAVDLRTKYEAMRAVQASRIAIHDRWWNRVERVALKTKP
jgi:hypothetical protein